MKYTDSLSTLLRPFSGWFDNSYSSVMKTDVKANDKEYTLSVDLPGVSKNDIEISLQDGYLTIEANRRAEETDKEANYVFREKTYGRMSRSFYVGDGISEDSIKAKYENGILMLDFPKEEKKAVESKRYISIEG